MKVYSINSSLTFGDKKGGVKYLQIIRKGKDIHFVNTTKKESDVSVFVAGGSEIDKRVHEANVRAMAKYNGTQAIIKKKPKI